MMSAAVLKKDYSEVNDLIRAKCAVSRGASYKIAIEFPEATVRLLSEAYGSSSLDAKGPSKFNSFPALGVSLASIASTFPNPITLTLTASPPWPKS